MKDGTISNKNPDFQFHQNLIILAMLCPGSHWPQSAGLSNSGPLMVNAAQSILSPPLPTLDPWIPFIMFLKGLFLTIEHCAFLPQPLSKVGK